MKEKLYKAFKDADIDLKSFHEKGLDLIPIDDEGTFRIVKKRELKMNKIEKKQISIGDTLLFDKKNKSSFSKVKVTEENKPYVFWFIESFDVDVYKVE